MTRVGAYSELGFPTHQSLLTLEYCDASPICISSPTPNKPNYIGLRIVTLPTKN